MVGHPYVPYQVSTFLLCGIYESIGTKHIVMIEFIFLLAVLYFIGVLFYRDTKDSFEILQLEAERLNELPDLYSEKRPIVLRGISFPPLGTYTEMKKRPHVLQLGVTPSLRLDTLLHSSALPTFPFTEETARFLAIESGLPVWCKQNLYPQIFPTFGKLFYSTRESLWPSHRGLWKTKAFYTFCTPTQGIASVKLLLPAMIPYLPVKWEGMNFDSLKTEDTPLLSQLQFVEVKVRAGTALCIPAHVLVNITQHSESPEILFTYIVDIHHPISRFA